MTPFAVPLHIAAVVLVVSGAAKIGDPRASTAAMATAGMVSVRSRRWPGIALGSMEVATGALCLAYGGVASALLVAVLHVGFLGFLVRLRRRDSNAACGCFGASSAPAGPIHVVLNLVIVVVAVGAALDGAPDVVDVVQNSVLEAVTHTLLVLTGAGLVVSAPPLADDLKRQQELLRT